MRIINHIVKGILCQWCNVAQVAVFGLLRERERDAIIDLLVGLL